jgi:hypothetical protein
MLNIADEINASGEHRPARRVEFVDPEGDPFHNVLRNWSAG